MALPTITVAVCTCNRSSDLTRCFEHLSQVIYPQWDVLVIDQSDDGRTLEAVECFVDRLPRLRYCQMPEKGLTRGRNLALRSAPGEILAFLDDDCTVGPGWLRDVAAAFARYPTVPLIFGQVRPIPHDPRQCFIPSHTLSKDRVLRGRPAFLRAGSLMGASMYLRRAACREIGPFDVYAGPGARFNIEDRDYAYRLLRAGYSVLLTPRVTVLHHGARYYSRKGTRAILRSYGYGFGAQDMKFLRCKDTMAPLIIVGHIVKMLMFILWRRLLLGYVRGSHVMWIVMYIYGLVAGIRAPIMQPYGLWGRPEEYDPEDILPPIGKTKQNPTAVETCRRFILQEEPAP